MNKTKSNIYNISGLEIEVETVRDGYEARYVQLDRVLRIRLAPGASQPSAGRYHPSMTLAEPIIPERVFFAMMDAVAKHSGSASAK